MSPSPPSPASCIRPDRDHSRRTGAVDAHDPFLCRLLAGGDGLLGREGDPLDSRAAELAQAWQPLQSSERTSYAGRFSARCSGRSTQEAWAMITTAHLARSRAAAGPPSPLDRAGSPCRRAAPRWPGRAPPGPGGASARPAASARSGVVLRPRHCRRPVVQNDDRGEAPVVHDVDEARDPRVDKRRVADDRHHLAAGCGTKAFSMPRALPMEAPMHTQVSMLLSGGRAERV